MPSHEIDRDKLRAALRSQSDDTLYAMLAEAIELLPPAKLAKLALRYFKPAQLRPDEKRQGSLLADVKAFEQASLRGDYYESFNVTSKNSMDQSKGTRAWIAEFDRFLDRCVKQAKRSASAEVRDAFEVLFGLLRHIDEALDDVIFFADEGGSWAVGVDWQPVLPAWFACLAATVEPEEYARKTIEAVDEFGGLDREKYLAAAIRVARAAQRAALRAAR